MIAGGSIGSRHLGRVGSERIGFQLIKISAPDGKPPDRLHAPTARILPDWETDIRIIDGGSIGAVTWSGSGPIGPLIKISGSGIESPPIGCVCPDGKNIARLGNRSAEVIVGGSIRSGDFTVWMRGSGDVDTNDLTGLNGGLNPRKAAPNCPFHSIHSRNLDRPQSDGAEFTCVHL